MNDSLASGVADPPLPALRAPSPAIAHLAYLGYDLLGGLAAAAALPALPWLLRRGFGDGAGERLGRLPVRALHLPTPPIWLHCASVGETRSAGPLVARLRDRVARPVVISTTTPSGRAVARDDLRADVATLLPVDALRIIDRVFRRVRPRLLVLVETELWPGLLRAAARVGAPVALVSGRLSARALERYRLAGPLFPAALSHVATFGMQTAADAERIIALGAPPARVVVTGTLKASVLPAAPGPPPIGGLESRRVVIAASTQPGEEAFVLQAFTALRRIYRDALLVIAPRRPERFDAVADLVAASGLPSSRRSSLAGDVTADLQVIVLDTLGELVRFFPVAWAVFVGGTVAPLGGHNVLEPANYGRPVSFGPHTDNVTEAAAALCTAGGGAVVRTPGELTEYWDGLLAQRATADAAGARAQAVAAARADALEETWKLLAPLLGVQG